MKDIGIGNLANRGMLIAACTMLATTLTIGNLSTVSAQGSGTWAIAQAQEAVRQQINNQDRGQERGRYETVRFNRDVQTEVTSNSSVRVSGTGTSGNNRGNNNAGRNREFTYEALVSNRGRNRGGTTRVSEVRYDWREWGGDNRGRDNRGRGNDNDNFDRGGNRPNGRVSYTGPIMNRHSDKALDVTGQSSQDGARIQQWGFADQPNQNWNIIDLGSGEVAIISRQSGMALTVQGGRDMNGATIIQRNWNDSRQQRWRLEDVGNGYYRIASADNGKVLDVSGQGRQDGANIQLWDYADHANQQWRLRR